MGGARPLHSLEPQAPPGGGRRAAGSAAPLSAPPPPCAFVCDPRRCACGGGARTEGGAPCSRPAPPSGPSAVRRRPLADPRGSARASRSVVGRAGAPHHHHQLLAPLDKHPTQGYCLLLGVARNLTCGLVWGVSTCPRLWLTHPAMFSWFFWGTLGTTTALSVSVIPF